MQEIWKDIYFIDKGITFDYRGLYQVSNFGRVKSLVKWDIGSKSFIREEKIMNANCGEYRKVGLRKDGCYKTISVHRLVALMFIPNPNNLPQVNHKDENKLNNKVDNLEWCSLLDNCRYGTRTERSNNKRTLYKIIQKDKNGNIVKLWNSASEIEKETDFKKDNIRKCCNKKFAFAYGYVWEYICR